MNSNIQGEPSRQAVDCLGGYAYQIYASALAWVTLLEGEVLHLEVAEDFAISTQTALTAVQVKRTEAKVTSNSAGIIAAIDSFVSLTLDNPSHSVTLRYLTTSEIGLEKRKEDRIDGESFVSTWSTLRKSGNLASLRKRLAKMELSQRTTDFIAAQTDMELRDRVLRKLWFDCGQPGFDALIGQLDDALVEVGHQKRIFAADSEKAGASVIERVLLCSCDAGNRELTRADFIRLFDQQNSVTVPNSTLQTIFDPRNLGVGEAQVSLSAIHPFVEPLIGDPAFANQAPRGRLLRSLSKRYHGGLLWLHAGTGYGKTHLAKMLVHSEGTKSGILRLRDMPPQQIAAILGRARSELLFSDYRTIVIDDVAGFETGTVTSAIRAFVEQARARQLSLIFTSYHRPSDQALAALALDSACCAEVEKLTDDDLLRMVNDAPANLEVWAKYVRFGGSNGHPQLSHALAEGLRRRGWPVKDLANMAAVFGSDEAINSTKDEIRRRLLIEMPENTRVLVYRLSLLTSSFDNRLVKAVAEVPDELSRSGELLDSLVGPWIDRLENNEFQLSPLLSGVGPAQLGQAEQQAVHAAIANALVQNHTIDSRRLDQLLVSGLAGKAQGALLSFVMATLGTDVEKLPLLASNCIVLSMLKTEQSIYPDNTRLSLQLRMVQTLFCLTESSEDKFRATLQAFEDELENLDDDEGTAILRMALGGKLLLMPQLADVYPEFPSLITQTVECAKLLEVNSEYDFPGDEDGYAGVNMGMGPALFIQQMTNVQHLESLAITLEHLAALSADDREALVPPRDSIRFNPEQIVKSIWVKAKEKPDYSSLDYAKKCLSFAKIFKDLGERYFAIGAFVTAAVIRSEELSEHDEALALLEQAEREMEADFALSRAKAGIYFNQNDYQRQLDTIEPVLPDIMDEGWIERTYLFRETAIAHGNLGHWGKCFQRFDEARQYASKAKIPQMTLMEIGLQADSAVALWNKGDVTAALKTINNALTRLETIDPSLGFRQKALWRLVRFTGFWMYSEFKNVRSRFPDVEAEMVIGCSSNPNPHSGLDEMPIGPVKMIKYLLAQIDIATGYAAGIWRNEVSQFSDRQAVLPLECTLCVEAFLEALKSGSPDRIVEFGPLYVDAKHTIDNGVLTQEEPDEFKTGKLPRVADNVWAEQRANLTYQIAVFMLNAIAMDQGGKIGEFLALTKATKRPLLEDEEVKCLENATPEVSGAAQSTFGAVGALRVSLAQGSRPVVPTLFMTSLRLLDAMRMSDGFASCIEFVANWAFQKWGEAIREERFRFTTPLLAEGAIYSALSTSARDLSSFARLIMAINPYIGVNLSGQHLSQLRQLADSPSE